MEKIYFADKSKALEIIKNIKMQWNQSLHFLADFDRTMTHAFLNGKPASGIISEISNNKTYLWEGYVIKSEELFNFYYPIENDHTIAIEDKIHHMKDWWQKHNALFVKYNLTKWHIIDAMWNCKSKLRPGIEEILSHTSQYNIPFIILSANGIWEEAILYYLEREDKNYKNIHIISNRFIFDHTNTVIWNKKPVIHIFNKSEITAKQFPDIFSKIADKKNVILLWDSLWDPHMIDGFDYDNLLKIWFYNEKNLTHLDDYLKVYDIVLTWDSSGREIKDLLDIF